MSHRNALYVSITGIILFIIVLIGSEYYRSLQLEKNNCEKEKITHYTLQLACPSNKPYAVIRVNDDLIKYTCCEKGD